MVPNFPQTILNFLDHTKSFTFPVKICGPKLFSDDNKVPFLRSRFLMTKFIFLGGKGRIFEYGCFCRFSKLEYDFGHQTSTSQTWCLEVRRIFFKDFMAKKRWSKEGVDDTKLCFCDVFWTK